MKIRVIILCLFLSNLVHGLSNFNTDNEKPNSLLEKIRANYQDLESVEIDIRYQLFKGFTSDELIQESNAVFYRKGIESYRKIENTELISNEEYMFNVDHENRRIIVSKSEVISPFDSDIKETLKYCKDARVLEKGGSKIIDLLIDDKADLPYARVKITVDKKYWIEKIEMFYSNQMDFSENYFEKDLEYPRLVIVYDVLKKKWKDSENVLASDNYVIELEGNLIPAQVYDGYEIYDLRTSEKQLK